MSPEHGTLDGMTVPLTFRTSPNPPASRRGFRPGILIAGSLQFVLLGCQTSSDVRVSPGPAMAPPPPRPIAMVDRERITIADVEPELLEAIGGRIVQEHVLDVTLARTAAREGMVIDAADLNRERAMLIANLAEDPDRGERLLEELRRSQGLGPIRFEALLRRTALLRRLVAEDVQITDTARRGAHDLRHGPRRTTRIIAVGDLRTAAEARARIAAGTPFATVAVESSLDASAARGGLLAPVSRLDPSWPAAFRKIVFQALFGDLSDPVQIDGRVLLVQVESEQPATGVTFEAGREIAEADARLAVERLLMDRLARRLMPKGRVEALDPSLRWSLSPIE
jgi:hypothetical protein